MKLSIGIVFLCFIVVTYAAPRIVGGKDAPEGKYKYQVSVRYGNSHFCGGSILDKRWILTAAHCVQGVGHNSVTVVAGTTLLEGGEEQVYQSEYVAWHKDYHLTVKQNDIAVIRVNKDIEFNDKVQPIALADKDALFESGHPATLTGWGFTEYPVGGLSNKLQEIHTKIHDQQVCKHLWNNYNDSHICTLTKKGEGGCSGDSGGPLVADGVQVGIVSYGSSCALGKPDVFTRVSFFRDWIAAEQAKF